MISKILRVVFLLIVLSGLTINVFAEEAVIYPSQDTYINQADENSINGAKTSLVAAYEGQGTANLAFVKFDLSSIPQGSTVSSAVFLLTSYYCKGNDQSPELLASTVIDSWSELTARFVGRPRTDMSIGILKPSVKTLSWDVKSKVDGWLKNSNTNYGIGLSIQGGPFTCKFYSKEYATKNVRPMLVVKYSPPPTPTKDLSIKPIVGSFGIKITPLVTLAAQPTSTPTPTVSAGSGTTATPEVTGEKESQNIVSITDTPKGNTKVDQNQSTTSAESENGKEQSGNQLPSWAMGTIVALALIAIAAFASRMQKPVEMKTKSKASEESESPKKSSKKQSKEVVLEETDEK